MRKLTKLIKTAVVSLYCLAQLSVFPGAIVADESLVMSPATGKVVVKQTEKDGVNLGVATFLLKNKENKKEVSKQTDPQTGEVVFDAIEPGTYTLTEKQPAVGYKKTEKTWEVVVEPNGKTTATGANVTLQEEVLSDQYPKKGTYQDNSSEYDIITVNDVANQNSSQVGEQFKAVNPNPYDRIIEEGSLSKRIYKVNDLNDNQYGIELTVTGKSKVETRDNSTPLDVVILLDNSNSMRNSRANAQRALKAGEATKALVDRITSNPNNQVALVTYGSTIFDGTVATVSKGVADRNNKPFNDSPFWTYNQTEFEATMRDYSFLRLTNNPNDIEILKQHIPLEAEELTGDKLHYQFGATFTQKALMKADEILSSQAREGSKRLIFHITDGVPTMSYPIKFDEYGTTYRNQLNAFFRRSGTQNGILRDDFIIPIPEEEHKFVRGDGQSYKMFENKIIYADDNRPSAYTVKNNEIETFRNEGYAVDGNYIFLYWRENILAYPFSSRTAKITNHGDPTTWYFNGNIKPKGYDIFTVGIGVNGDPGATPEQATEFMKSISSRPENYVNVSDTNRIFEHLNNYFNTIVEEKKSIENGTITDPMGKLIDFQLGDNKDFDPSDYVLVGNDNSKLENGKAVGGPNGDGGILQKAQVTFDKEKQTIKVTGLYLGTGDKVTLTYNVRLNDQFVSNQFYDTNDRTTLHPKEREPNTIRDFPIPKIRDVRKYPRIEIQKEKQFGAIEFIKVNKLDMTKPLENAVFTLNKEYQDYGIYVPLPPYQKMKTKNDGKLVFSNLEDGKYQLFENESPTGFQTVKDKKILDFEVKGGQITKVVSAAEANSAFGYEEKDGKHYITNTPIPPKREYPKTGGNGVMLFYIIGSILMGSAVVMSRQLNRRS